MIDRAALNEPHDKLTITFIVTKDCNFRCKYCYMVHKRNDGRMSFEVAKAAADYFLENREHVRQDNVIWEFIGGEPLLEIDLVEKIIDYTRIRAWQLDHPWFENAMYSFSTNGTLYDHPKFQRLLAQYPGRLDVGLTLDGPAHVHDRERIFPDGSGTHAHVIRNLERWMKNTPTPATKVTISHDTLPTLAESILYLFSVGMVQVNANVVFEDVWEEGDDDILEEQLDLLGDTMIEQDLWREHACSFFSRVLGAPLPPQMDQNWCGAGKYMIAVDAEGKFYPCVRFVDHSLVKQEPIVIGDTKNGIDLDELKPFYELSRSGQSNQECMECEVASGCAWCQGFNYDDSGDINHRATYICKMHKARARANKRFWDKIDAITGGSPMETKASCEVNPNETPCGRVSAEERDEIKALFERKMGLAEVFQALAKMEPEARDQMYDKAVSDMGETSRKFHTWWERTAKKHNWEAVAGGSWRIDFDSCEVFLVRP